MSSTRSGKTERPEVAGTPVVPYGYGTTERATTMVTTERAYDNCGGCCLDEVADARHRSTNGSSSRFRQRG